MTTLQFARPEFLFLLLAIPLLMITHYILFKFTKKKGMIFANFETLKRVTGKHVLTKNMTVLLIRVFVFLCLILALSEPTITFEGEQLPSDYILAIDTSASMTADDLKPTRLDAAKLAATRFVESIEPAARIGVVGFAGTVSIEETPTKDHEAVLQAIEGMEITLSSGTDIGSVLITGTNLLLGADEGKVMILFTDGSSTVGVFKEDPVASGASYAVQQHVAVHTVGIGQAETAPTGYLPRIYNVTAAYNADSLQFIANQTGGTFMTASDNQALMAGFADIIEEPRSRLQVQELWLGFLLLGLLLLFLEWGLINTRFRFIP